MAVMTVYGDTQSAGGANAAPVWIMLHISEIPDSDFTNSRTAVSV